MPTRGKSVSSVVIKGRNRSPAGRDHSPVKINNENNIHISIPQARSAARRRKKPAHKLSPDEIDAILSNEEYANALHDTPSYGSGGSITLPAYRAYNPLYRDAHDYEDVQEPNILGDMPHRRYPTFSSSETRPQHDGFKEQNTQTSTSVSPVDEELEKKLQAERDKLNSSLLDADAEMIEKLRSEVKKGNRRQGKLIYRTLPIRSPEHKQSDLNRDFDEEVPNSGEEPVDSELVRSTPARFDETPYTQLDLRELRPRVADQSFQNQQAAARPFFSNPFSSAFSSPLINSPTVTGDARVQRPTSQHEIHRNLEHINKVANDMKERMDHTSEILKRDHGDIPKRGVGQRGPDKVKRKQKTKPNEAAGGKGPGGRPPKGGPDAGGGAAGGAVGGAVGGAAGRYLRHI